MAIQTKYQKDLEDGKIKPKPVVVPAPPKKVVVPARTVLKNSTPKAAPPKAAPIPSYGRPMPVPKTLVRPPVAPPRTMKDPQQDFVSRGGGKGASIVVPPGKSISPYDAMLMTPLGMVGSGASGLAALVGGVKPPTSISSVGRQVIGKILGNAKIPYSEIDNLLGSVSGFTKQKARNWAMNAATNGVVEAGDLDVLRSMVGPGLADEIMKIMPIVSATVKKVGGAVGVPSQLGAAGTALKSTAAGPVGAAAQAAAGNAYTAQAIADAWRKLGGAGGNILQYLGGVAGRNPKLTGAAALGAAGLGYYGLNGGFDGGNGIPEGGMPGDGGNFAPGLFTNPSTVNFGPDNGSNRNYKTPLPLPPTPEVGLDKYGRNIGNWQQMLIANGLSPVDPNVPPPPPFVPGDTPPPPPPPPPVTPEGPPANTNTGGGFFGPQSMAEMMAMFTQMKDLFGDAGSAALDQIMGLYTELQKSMMDLQNKYIQSLIDAQKPVAPPVAPAPNLGPEAFVPPYISPSAQNGAYLEMSDPGMGALYNMNPMYLQSVQQMLNTLGYKGAGVAGRYGERSYSRPGGPGSLAIGDAAYENAANYVGLPATERENAEAAMRYFFGEMGNSPRYQFPGRPQYPTRA